MLQNFLMKILQPNPPRNKRSLPYGSDQYDIMRFWCIFVWRHGVMVYFSQESVMALWVISKKLQRLSNPEISPPPSTPHYRCLEGRHTKDIFCEF